jgi:2-dehydro-3-deoxygluconokinase
MSTLPGNANRVVCFGECMLELQGTAFGRMQQTFGGDTLNTAVYLARCGSQAGLQVDYATALGDDALSMGLLQRWQEQGVGTALVRQLPGRLPGLYMINVDDQGERRFSYWRGQAAARDYFEAPVGNTPLEQAVLTLQALYFSGISLAILPPQGQQRLLAVAAQVRAQGGVVAFDNNLRPSFWRNLDDARAAFRAATAVASMAFMTLEDEQTLWQEPDAQRQVQHTLALTCAEVVIKRGAEPTLVRADEGPPFAVPTVPVGKVVDTTAAGDSFAGAYLASRMIGRTPLQAAQAANRLAAVVIQHPGAIIAPSTMAHLVGL